VPCWRSAWSHGTRILLGSEANTLMGHYALMLRSMRNGSGAVGGSPAANAPFIQVVRVRNIDHELGMRDPVDPPGSRHRRTKPPASPHRWSPRRREFPIVASFSWSKNVSSEDDVPFVNFPTSILNFPSRKVLPIRVPIRRRDQGLLPLWYPSCGSASVGRGYNRSTSL